MKTWNPRYKILDHWRGIAALWVMMFHGFGTTYDKSLHPIAEFLKSIAAPGWLGVHIFFVISGYCIAANIYKLILNKGTPWNFIKDRALRLFPVYWLAFLLSLAINLILSPFNSTNFWENFPPSWQSWAGNLLLMQPYINTNFYVVVYWSLVVEFGFYLICTTLLIIKSVFGKKTAVFIGLFLAFISVFIFVDRLGLLKYWCEFICGVLLFVALFSKYKTKTYLHNVSLLLISIFCGLSIWINLTTDRSSQLWFSAVFAIFLYFAYELDEKIDAIKQIEYLKFVGIMSYSLYLLHVTFQGRVINLGSRFIQPESIMILPLQVTGWLVALIGSYIFYLLAEKPLNNWRCRKKSKFNQ